MFDALFAGLGESALLAVIEQAGREEAAAGARRLAAIAELVHSTVEDDPAHGGWVFDDWNNAACEVGAVLSLSRKRASGQMWIAVALRYRLPRIAVLCCQGRLSPRLISEITWRTRLVADEVVAVVDAAIAGQAERWGPLSDAKLTASIEAVIERYDPDAVRRAREVIRARDLHIGAHEDPNEMAAIWGQLLAGDAAALEVLITAMVSGICDNDPRPAGERRSDAMGAFIQGNAHLACRCGSPGCSATAPAKSKVLVRVIADQAAVEAARKLIATQDREQQQALADKDEAKPAAASEPTPESEPMSEGESTSADEPTPEGSASEGEPADTESAPEDESASEVEPAVESEPAPSSVLCQRNSGVALLPGGRVLPIAALAEAIRGGAAIKALWLPGPDPEPHYQPSARLAEFIRARDVFCRFPGCDVPAERCDIDHVVPWPYGPTHPSNLNCKCRTHHIGKTFWEGWRDVQQPDATVIWTDPTGRSFTTMPGSRLFFPTWNTTTAELPPMAQPPPDPDRLAKMPKRRRTRAAERAARIKAEREANATQRALDRQRIANARARGEPAETPPTDYGNDPPPF
jgi:uncharacterized protein DUF222